MFFLANVWEYLIEWVVRVVLADLSSGLCVLIMYQILLSLKTPEADKSGMTGDIHTAREVRCKGSFFHLNGHWKIINHVKK